MSSGVTADMPVLSAAALDVDDPFCAQCGAELDDDQEWCLECGAARTLIHRPPDWRMPVAIAALVVALVLAGFTVALVNLSSTTNAGTASAPSPTAASAAAPSSSPAPAAATPAVRPHIGSWPVGLSGWTVVLFTSHSEARANAVATRLAISGLGVGVLDSDHHPDLGPGIWVVFAGRYPHGTEAAAAAARLKASGYPSARARQVARPGGL